MPQHVEFVEYDLGVRCMVVGRLPEGLPHVHDGKLDAFGGIWPDFLEEEVHVLFLAAFSAHPDRAALVEIGHNDCIGVTLAYGNFVDPDGTEVLGRRMFGQEVAHIVLLDAPYLIPAQPVHFGHPGNGHLAALTAYSLLESLGEPPGGGQPGKGLLLHGLAPPAEHPAVLEFKVYAHAAGVEVPDPMGAAVVEASLGTTARASRFF